MNKDIKYFWNAQKNNYISLERFNLLLLEPGEIYFEDFSVYYYSSQLKEEEAIKRRQKGRLKVCSKSILFDPLDSTYPILKFLYKNVVNIGKWSGKLLSPLEGEVIYVEALVCIAMKEGNLLAPYQYNKNKNKHVFSLNFVNTNGILPQIEQLRRAHTLNPHESATMISTIVNSRQARMKFNTSWIEDLYENIVHETTASKIAPLVCNPGRILLTSKRIYFQPFNNVESQPVIKVSLSNVKQITKRRYLLRHVGLEIFQRENNIDVYFIFENPVERDLFYENIISQEDLHLPNTQQDNMTLKWQNGVLSNFDYLLYLNSIADRSFNDLTQYPVFPWIIKDYISQTLNLDDPNTFRDLSKPIGALDEQRLFQLRERSKGMSEPKFLYGSHYSTPGFVLYYLVRVAPEYMLCLQNGKFDKADRLFNSILPTWNNCCTGHSDYKELIPEFYDSDGSFLCNSLNLNLGKKQDGSFVHDVELPPWASGPSDFIRKCREALECDYVSQEINNWIDLIFGYKQTGDEAWKADNVFYYLTYEGALDLESIENDNERKCLEAQILEFGQTPKQLFTKPHPSRMSVAAVRDPPVDKQLEMTEEKLSSSIPVIELNDKFNGLTPVELQGSPLSWTSDVKLKTSSKLHKESVLGMDIFLEDNLLVTISQDTQMKLFSLTDFAQIRSMNLSSMALSCCQTFGDEKHVLIGSWDNNIYVYSLEFSRVVDQLQGHDDAVSSLCSQNNILASSSWDATVKLWNYDGSCKKSFSIMGEFDHDTEVLCCDLLVNDSTCQLVSGTKDGTVTMWNVELQMASFQNNVHTEAVTNVLFSPDGGRVLSCSEDHYMRIFDISTEVEIYSKDVGEGISCACWDGQTVVVGGHSGDVMVWNLLKATCLKRLSFHKEPVRCLSYNMREKVLTSGSADGYVAIWDI